MNKPLPAYEGSEPFVFVCYAHTDSGVVYPEIERLHDQGFKIWYDDGIAPGSEWSDAIARAIENCQVFLYLITPNSVTSEHCRREVNFAVEQECSMLAVHLEPTQVPQGLRLSLSHRQAILKYENSPERYAARLKKALEDAARGSSADPEFSSRSLQIGDAVLDIETQRLHVHGEEHLLEPKDMSVILHLADAAPGLVSTEEILNRSWPGLVVGDNVVHQVIGRLRKAFGDSARNPKYVETMPRRGYRLLPPVTPLQPAPPQRPAMEVPAAHQPNASVVQGITPPVASSAQKKLKVWWVALPGVAVVALLIWLAMVETSTRTTHPNSIAVLSFVDLSVNSRLDTLGDDIAIQLNNELGKYEGLRMVSNTASFAFKESERDIQYIGEELSVAFVVTGTVLQYNDRIRVTMELVPVVTLFQQWGDILMGDARDLLTIGQDIAAQAAPQIAQSIGAQVPALQLNRQNNNSKPRLQNLFEPEAGNQSPEDFPSFDEIDIQSADDFGDVE